MKHLSCLFVCIFLFASVFTISNFCHISEGKSVISNFHTHQNSSISTNHFENHSYLEINSDQELVSIASSEGWDGDGSANNPYLIQNYLFNNASENPSIAVHIKTSISYTHGGYSSFDLILNDVDSFITIQYNNFTHSVLISHTSHVNLIGNNWINKTNSENLMISSYGVNVTNNVFSGIDPNCNKTSNNPTPRIYTIGTGINIFRNVFTMDTGCFPIQNIAIKPPTPEAFPPANILVYANLFETSDIAITNEAQDVYIYNNDFLVGDFAIGSPGGPAHVYNNNFIDSLIGKQDSQIYDGVVSYFVYSYYDKEKGPPKSSFYIQNSNIIDANYYDSWKGPDRDGDGIVDDPFQYGKTSAEFDYHPSTTKFPGYYDYNETQSIVSTSYGRVRNSDGSKTGYKTIMIIGITIPALLILEIIRRKIHTSK